jgi:hypothetical protein
LFIRHFPVSVQSTSTNLLDGRKPLALLLLLHLPLLALQPLRAGLTAAQPWILAAAVAAFFLFFRQRSAGTVCWTRMCSLLLLADALLLGAAVLFNDAAFAALAAVCVAAACCTASADKVMDRHLGCLSLLLLLPLSPPERIANLFQRLFNEPALNLTSWMAWSLDILHYRTQQVLSSDFGAVNIGQMLWNPAAFRSFAALCVIWSIVRRRSVIQTTLLIACLTPLFLLLTAAAGTLVLRGTLRAAIDSPILPTACLLPLYLPFILSADAWVRLMTSPVPAVLRPGEAAAWDNPFIVGWNVFVAGIAEVPLDVFEPREFRMPTASILWCVLMLPCASAVFLLFIIRGA